MEVSKKSIKILKKNFLSKKFLAFFTVGLTAFVIDTAVLNIIRFIIYDGKDPQVFGLIFLSKLVSSTFGLATSFFLNRNITFKETNEKTGVSAVKFIISQAFILLTANVLFVSYSSFLVQVIDKETIVANFSNVLTEGTKMILSFIVYKHFVFKKLRKSS